MQMEKFTSVTRLIKQGKLSKKTKSFIATIETHAKLIQAGPRKGNLYMQEDNR